MGNFTFDISLPIVAANAGLFISRGVGRHPSRVVSFFDLIYVRTGVLGIQEDDVAFTVNPGESLLLWPDRHHFGTVDYPADLSFFWIHFESREAGTHPVSFLDTPPETGGEGEAQGEKSSHFVGAGLERGGGLVPVAREATSTSDAPAGDLLNPLRFVQDDDRAMIVPQHAVISRSDQLSEAFRRYLDDQQAGEATAVSADLTMLLILSEVARSPAVGENRLHSIGASAGKAPASTVLASRARVFLRSHFHEDIGAASVAAEVGCNPNYLARVYRESYGQTITEAIHGARLEHARRLLLAGHHYVDEIARLSGFADVDYFRRLFKRAHGMTPVAFRRLYARVHVNTE